MPLFLIVLLVALLGGVALVGAGFGGGLGGEAPARRPSSRLRAVPRGATLEGLRFEVVLRGYRMDEVDEALAVLQAEIVRRDQRLAALEARAGVAEDTPVAGEDEPLDARAAEVGPEPDDRPQSPDGPDDVAADLGAATTAGDR